MVDINYRLHNADDTLSTEYKEHPGDHVPRVGDIIAIGPTGRSYQVLDVLWHFYDSGDSVTVTAAERDWHAHIKQVTDTWHRSLSS